MRAIKPLTRPWVNESMTFGSELALSSVAGLRLAIIFEPKRGDMKTSCDVREFGLYASDCCGEELIFNKDGCFSRCPRCERFCEWELVEKVVPWFELQEDEPVEQFA